LKIQKKKPLPALLPIKLYHFYEEKKGMRLKHTAAKAILKKYKYIPYKSSNCLSADKFKCYLASL
jgi:hypothetical protein